MIKLTFVRALALAGAFSLAWPAQAALDVDPQAWNEARQALREQRWAAAYGRLATLADAGHGPAARLALVFLQHGPELFGSAWSASLPQQQRWARTAQLEPGVAASPDLAGRGE